jgi:hypothetical protein
MDIPMHMIPRAEADCVIDTCRARLARCPAIVGVAMRSIRVSIRVHVSNPDRTCALLDLDASD